MRNPYTPVEIAYYHPAPILGEPLSAGSQVFGSDGSGWQHLGRRLHDGFSVFHLSNTAGPMPAARRPARLPRFPGVMR